MISADLVGKLANLPDVYTGSVACAKTLIEKYGMEDEVLELLESGRIATTEDVLFLVIKQNNFEEVPIIDD